MRRAKIVATFGPAVADYDKARAVIEAGVDVARMNLSHGSHEVHDSHGVRDFRAANDFRFASLAPEDWHFLWVRGY